MDAISVIIPSYNSASTIMRTLAGVLSQPAEKLKEIIVVDSSDDGKTPPLLEKYSDRIRLVRLDKKTMPAIGRNIGASYASGHTLAFIDSDAYPAPDWIEKIIQARAKGSRVGGGAILIPDFQEKNSIALAQYFLQFNEFTDSARYGEKTFAPSCNLFCEKGLFQATGGFPEIRASEDVLFGLAVGHHAQFYFHPDIRVYHIFRSELKSYLSNQLLLGRYILIYRRNRAKSFLNLPWVVIFLLPLIFIAKFLRITMRVLRGKPRYWLKFMRALPFFLLGLGAWCAGFAEEALKPERAAQSSL